MNWDHNNNKIIKIIDKKDKREHVKNGLHSVYLV